MPIGIVFVVRKAGGQIHPEIVERYSILSCVPAPVTISLDVCQ